MTLQLQLIVSSSLDLRFFFFFTRSSSDSSVPIFISVYSTKSPVVGPHVEIKLENHEKMKQN